MKTRITLNIVRENGRHPAGTQRAHKINVHDQQS